MSAEIVRLTLHKLMKIKLLPITVKSQKICNINSTYLKEPLIYKAYSRSVLVFFRNTICCGRFLAF